MDPEKRDYSKDDSSSLSSNDPMAPASKTITDSPSAPIKHEAPKSWLPETNDGHIHSHMNKSGPTGSNDVYNNDLERYETSSSQLSRAMSHPDNLRRLESLTRVISSRRMSIPGASDVPLSVNPDDFDLNALLRSIGQRLDAQGAVRKYTGFSLKDVTSWGIDATTAYGPSVSELLRSFVTFPSQIAQLRNKKVRPVIKTTNALVREGELLLVLGRPGSGCTSFLKTIAGEVDQFTKIEGDISYSGATQQDMLRKFKADVIYTPECKFSWFFF